MLLVITFIAGCTKEDPKPCPEPPQVCEATPFIEGFKTNLVGKWRFYKVAWYNQLGTFQGYKDTIDLDVTYEFEINENGTIDYYRNDSFLIQKKLDVWYEVEGNPPVEPLGVVSAYLDCVVGGNPAEEEFGSALFYQDTLMVQHHPIVFRVEATGEFSGNGYFYRKN